ncbi:MAG: chorismate mutase [Dehalococcoidia bacterium]|nr:chorismate mutase [Dehalococcoidia bacterium]
MPVRGLRGATTAEANTADAIFAATRELLAQLVSANGLEVDDIASAFFTATPDLTAGFPAAAARQLGWTHAALIDALEVAVPGDVPRCIRVLLHVNTGKRQDQMQFVYLREAQSLRATVPPLA